MSIPPSSNPTAKRLYDSAAKSLRRNHLPEAESFAAQAIALDETNATYWLQLGVIWGKMGRHSEAVEANTMALTLAPTSADALYNLGLCQMNMGNEEKAIDYLEQSYRAGPSDDLAEKLAVIFRNKKNYKSAAYYLLHLYKTKKNMMKTPLLLQLGQALYYNGDFQQSLGIAIELMKRDGENLSVQNLLLDLYRRVPHAEFHPDAKKILVNFLKKNNTNFLFLRNPWISLFLLDPDYAPLRSYTTQDVTIENLCSHADLLHSDFLCLGLTRGLAISAPIENILTHIRRAFLLNWRDSNAWPPAMLRFIASLAVSCWYNDYVYFVSNEEKNALDELSQYIKAQLATPCKECPLATAVALLSCYKPLYEFCDNIAQIDIPKKFARDLEPLITSQYDYPRREKEIIPTIRSFCTIDDETSRLVQEMYTARPYPRWISTTTSLRENADQLEKTKDHTVLIAGCGTGHEAALYANMLPGAKITAVDLSPPSLAYGVRMLSQLGLASHVDFYHGDLMKIGEMNKSFDFVASSGVLHHLKNPEKGLEAILRTLKKGGRLSLSLYSKHARDYVLNPALDYIRSQGYSSSADDIRQFRKDVMHMTPDNPVTRCTTAGDFYFLSECNDLLFHVQEHRYTPHMIWDMAERHGLVPFHISMTPERLKAFHDMFPEQSPLNADLLEQFEEAHPKAFIEMFKIFFHRKHEENEHPFDYLIRAGNL